MLFFTHRQAALLLQIPTLNRDVRRDATRLVFGQQLGR
jgi:hypothetical protein